MRNVKDYRFEFFHHFFDIKMPKSDMFNMMAFYDYFHEYFIHPFHPERYIYDQEMSRKGLKKSFSAVADIMKYLHVEIHHDEFRKKYDVSFYFKKYNKIHFTLNLTLHYDKEVVVEFKYSDSFRRHVRFKNIPEHLSRFFYETKYVEVIYTKKDQFVKNIYFRTNNTDYILQEHWELEDGTYISYLPYYDTKLVLKHDMYIYYGECIYFSVKYENGLYMYSGYSTTWKRDVSGAMIDFLNDSKVKINHLGLEELKVVEMIDY